MSTFTSRSPTAFRPAGARWILLFGLLAAGAAFAATPGAAAEPEVSQRVVKYSPDSLSTESGARELYGRLVRAAEDVCPGDSSGRRFLNNAILACRRQAVENAVRAIGSPRLAALHASRSGHG